jgi:hypothetical protein
MAALSISRAWEETKARIVTDGRLMSIVAAALIVLPGLVVEVVSPGGASTQSSATYSILFLVSSLLALVGQLSIIKMAVGPHVSVSEAIGHGARRMPIYLLAAILLTFSFIVLAIPFAAVAYAAGAPMGPGAEQQFLESPVGLLVTCLYVALVIFVAMRMLMSSPVASEEAAGPVQILRRSWELTGGHWLRLFGFMMTFFIGAIVSVAVVNWAISFVAVILFGPIEPMSLSALVIGLFDSVVSAGVTVLLAVMLARIYVQLAGRGAAGASVPKSGT